MGLKSGQILLFCKVTSEKISYRKLPIAWNHTIIKSRDRQISCYFVVSLEQEGDQMGRKPKTTGPTARNNPDAFKQVLTRMSPDGWRALRRLALEEDTTLNALAIEAFNDLLRKYGKKASVQNPLVD